MNKKTKKRIEILRQKQDKFQKLLNDATAQTDDPVEVQELQRQVDDIKAEIEKLKTA